MYTVTLSKFKGGRRKTTVQLATLYALLVGVLVVDNDPQGGATKRLLAGVATTR